MASLGPVRLSRTLLPLALAVAAFAAYGAFWWHSARTYETELRALDRADSPLRIHGETLEVGGFPYRLEATWTDATLERRRADYALVVRAPRVSLIRQPWRSSLSVGFVEAPRIEASLPPVTPLPRTLRAGARAAQFSLHLGDKGVERLSIQLDGATLATRALFGADITAQTLEIHGREPGALRQPPMPRAAKDSPSPANGGKTAASGAAPPADPNRPAFLEIMLRADKARFGGAGPSERLAATLVATGAPPAGAASPLEAWRAGGGVVQLYGFDIAAPRLKFLASATFALGSGQALLGAGTVQTNAPDALLAALRRQPPPAAPLLARPVDLAVELSGETVRAHPRSAESRALYNPE